MGKSVGVRKDGGSVDTGRTDEAVLKPLSEPRRPVLSVQGISRLREVALKLVNSPTKTLPDHFIARLIK